jgi:hypothetical protein
MQEFDYQDTGMGIVITIIRWKKTEGEKVEKYGARIDGVRMSGVADTPDEALLLALVVKFGGAVQAHHNMRAVTRILGIKSAWAE